MSTPSSWELPSQPPGNHPAGWYPDPWGQAPWRWWDGWAWTVSISGNEDASRGRRPPILPAWLSPWVLGFSIPVALGVVALLFIQPLAILLGLVPFAIVLPALWWLDRVEPEPLSARVHAILWGATVAIVVSGVLNTIVGLALGETIAAVISAPVVEEGIKGLGVWYAVKRLEVDGVMDGVVYAGWVAIGFAVVEDFLYLSESADEGLLWQTFVVRAILTPFAHPLFTFWIGLAIGIAISRSEPVFPTVLWGYGLAVLTHMMWNGSLTAADFGLEAVLPVALVLFIALFFTVAVSLILVRRRQKIQFISLAPWIAHTYGMSPEEVAVFGNWRQMLKYRRRLPRRDRRRFDEIHSCLARLALLHEQPGHTDRVKEQLLADNLAEARYGNPR